MFMEYRKLKKAGYWGILKGSVIYTCSILILLSAYALHMIREAAHQGGPSSEGAAVHVCSYIVMLRFASENLICRR